MGDRVMHDFRRAGLSDKVVTGHKTGSVYDRYNIVDEQDYTTRRLCLIWRRNPRWLKSRLKSPKIKWILSFRKW